MNEERREREMVSVLMRLKPKTGSDSSAFLLFLYFISFSDRNCVQFCKEIENISQGGGRKEGKLYGADVKNV